MEKETKKENGSMQINKTISERVENKLIELLESINKETATPEMLEASARIAEVLFANQP